MEHRDIIYDTETAVMAPGKHVADQHVEREIDTFATHQAQMPHEDLLLCVTAKIPGTQVDIVTANQHGTRS
jgi:hypothetical protein